MQKSNTEKKQAKYAGYSKEEIEQILNKFAKLFSNLMIKENLTKEELAEKLYLSEKTIQNYLDGLYTPSSFTIMRLVETFNIDLRSFFNVPSHDEREIVGYLRIDNKAIRQANQEGEITLSISIPKERK